MSLFVLAEPSTLQRVEMPHEKTPQSGQAPVVVPNRETLINELRFEKVALSASVNVSATVSLANLATPETGTIDSLDIGEYRLLRPIPYQIERIQKNDFLATFAEANIGIGGVDFQDAYQNLVAEIVDTFETLIVEPRLSPAAAQQLQTLRTYFGRS